VVLLLLSLVVVFLVVVVVVVVAVVVIVVVGVCSCWPLSVTGAQNYGKSPSESCFQSCQIAIGILVPFFSVQKAAVIAGVLGPPNEAVAPMPAITLVCPTHVSQITNHNKPPENNKHITINFELEHA
jgi:D-alanyl-lipoteichoic acid acyltransferase DltB (MBOAT superfamily)